MNFKFTRRKLIETSAIMTSSALLTLWVEKTWGKNLSYYNWQIGAASLVHTHNANNINTKIIINPPSLHKEAKVLLHLFNPNGDVVWKKQLVIGSSSVVVQPPPNLGRVSILCLVETANDIYSPSVEMSVFLSREFKNRRDGHHILRQSKRSSCFHIVASEFKDSATLAAFQNPYSFSLSGKIIFYNKLGTVIFEETFHWKPFETKYIKIGNQNLNLYEPKNTINKNYNEAFILIKFINDEKKSVVICSETHTAESFTTSHGFISNDVEALEKEDSAIDLKLPKNWVEMNPAQLLSLDYSFAPGDLVYFDHSQNLESTVIVPNLVNKAVNINFFVYDEAGRLILYDTPEKNPMLKNIPPNGFVVLHCKNLHKTNFFKSQKNGIAIVHAGQKPYIASCIKNFSSSDKNNIFVQHFRPSENYPNKTQLQAIKDKTVEYATDYWTIGEVYPDTSPKLIIRNIQNLVIEDWSVEASFTQINNTHKIKGTKIEPGGFVVLNLPSDVKKKELLVVRLISKTSRLSMSFLNDYSKPQSFIHGQPRVRDKNELKKQSRIEKNNFSNFLEDI